MWPRKQAKRASKHALLHTFSYYAAGLTTFGKILSEIRPHETRIGGRKQMIYLLTDCKRLLGWESASLGASMENDIPKSLTAAFQAIEKHHQLYYDLLSFNFIGLISNIDNTDIQRLWWVKN